MDPGILAGKWPGFGRVFTVHGSTHAISLSLTLALSPRERVNLGTLSDTETRRREGIAYFGLGILDLGLRLNAKARWRGGRIEIRIKIQRELRRATPLFLVDEWWIKSKVL